MNVVSRDGKAYPNPASPEALATEKLIESYRRLATGTISLGPTIRITNIEVPGAFQEFDEETEQTFTRKGRKEYRQSIPAAAPRKKVRKRKPAPAKAGS